MTRRPRFDGAFFPNARIEGTANTTLTDTGENAIRLAIERLFPCDTSGTKGRVRGSIIAPARRRNANENIMKEKMESARRRFVPKRWLLAKRRRKSWARVRSETCRTPSKMRTQRA